jgi:hypothetical protein
MSYSYAHFGDQGYKYSRFSIESNAVMRKNCISEKNGNRTTHVDAEYKTIAEMGCVPTKQRPEGYMWPHVFAFIIVLSNHYCCSSGNDLSRAPNAFYLPTDPPFVVQNRGYLLQDVTKV